jgi:hypothetical protein
MTVTAFILLIGNNDLSDKLFDPPGNFDRARHANAIAHHQTPCLDRGILQSRALIRHPQGRRIPGARYRIPEIDEPRTDFMSDSSSSYHNME